MCYVRSPSFALNIAIASFCAGDVQRIRSSRSRDAENVTWIWVWVVRSKTVAHTHTHAHFIMRVSNIKREKKSSTKIIENAVNYDEWNTVTKPLKKSARSFPATTDKPYVFFFAFERLNESTNWDRVRMLNQTSCYCNSRTSTDSILHFALCVSLNGCVWCFYASGTEMKKATHRERKRDDAKCFCGKWDKCNNEIVSNRNGIKFIFSTLWIPAKMPAISQPYEHEWKKKLRTESNLSWLFALLKFCSSGKKWRGESADQQRQRRRASEWVKNPPNINCLHSMQHPSAINYLGKYVLNVFLAAPYSRAVANWQQTLGLIR